MQDANRGLERAGGGVTAAAGLVVKELSSGACAVYLAGREAGRSVVSQDAAASMIWWSRVLIVAILVAAVSASRLGGGLLSLLAVVAAGSLGHRWWLKRRLAALPPSDVQLSDADQRELRRRASLRGVLAALLVTVPLTLLAGWVYPLGTLPSLAVGVCAVSVVAMGIWGVVRLDRLTAPVPR